MSAEVHIEQFKLSDRAELLDYLRTAYPAEPRKCDPVFWQWHFLESPRADPRDLPLWVVKRDGRISGQLAAVPVDVRVGAASLRAIWILDLIIDPSLRGRGIGQGLIEAACAAHTTLLALGMNEQSRRILKKLRWADLGTAHRYQRLLYPAHALPELARRPALRRLVNAAYTPWRMSARAGTAPGAVVRALSAFDDSFDELWRRASAQWPCAVERGRRMLDWQYVRQPGKRFDVLALSREGRLDGYAVLFVRRAEGASAAPAKASITDLLYAPERADETIDELLGAALRLAVERRAGSLVTDVLDRRIELRLARLRFRRIKRAPQFMAQAGAHGELLFEPANWFITRGDSDVSIFEEPNL